MDPTHSDLESVCPSPILAVPEILNVLDDQLRLEISSTPTLPHVSLENQLTTITLDQDDRQDMISNRINLREIVGTSRNQTMESEHLTQHTVRNQHTNNLQLRSNHPQCPAHSMLPPSYACRSQCATIVSYQRCTVLRVKESEHESDIVKEDVLDYLNTRCSLPYHCLTIDSSHRCIWWMEEHILVLFEKDTATIHIVGHHVSITQLQSHLLMKRIPWSFVTIESMGISETIESSTYGIKTRRYNHIGSTASIWACITSHQEFVCFCNCTHHDSMYHNRQVSWNDFTSDCPSFMKERCRYDLQNDTDENELNNIAVITPICRNGPSSINNLHLGIGIDRVFTFPHFLISILIPFFDDMTKLNLKRISQSWKSEIEQWFLTRLGKGCSVTDHKALVISQCTYVSPCPQISHVESNSLEVSKGVEKWELARMNQEYGKLKVISLIQIKHTEDITRPCLIRVDDKHPLNSYDLRYIQRLLSMFPICRGVMSFDDKRTEDENVEIWEARRHQPGLYHIPSSTYIPDMCLSCFDSYSDIVTPVYPNIVQDIVSKCFTTSTHINHTMGRTSYTRIQLIDDYFDTPNLSEQSEEDHESSLREQESVTVHDHTDEDYSDIPPLIGEYDST